MSFFSKSLSSLLGAVGNGLPSRGTDVKNTRNALKQLGFYDGDTDLEYMDHRLDTSIRNFQKERGLREDGRLFPGGETERELNRAHYARRNPDTVPVPVRPLNLSGDVGSNLANREQDVRQVQRALGAVGALPRSFSYDANGIIDRRTVDGIRSFQRAHNLREDGLLRPDGETMQALNSRIATLRTAQDANDSNSDNGNGNGNGQTEGAPGAEPPPPSQPPASPPADQPPGEQPPADTPPKPPKKPEEDKPNDEDDNSECEELREEMESLQSEQSISQTEIDSLKIQIQALEQETQAAYREFVEISSRSQSSRIPAPSQHPPSFAFSLIFGHLEQQTTPDALDEQKAWKRYEEIKKRNDDKIETLNKEIRKPANKMRELQKKIEEVTAKYRKAGCGKRK